MMPSYICQVCKKQEGLIAELRNDLSETREHCARMVEALQRIVSKQVEVSNGKSVGAAFPEAVCIAGEALSSTPAQVKEWVEGVKNQTAAEALDNVAKRAEQLNLQQAGRPGGWIAMIIRDECSRWARALRAKEKP